MRRGTLAAIFAALAAGAGAIQAEAANPRPATIPALREWEGGVGTFQLRSASRIVIPRRQRRRLRADARLFASDLAALTGRRPRVVASRRRRLRPGDIRMSLAARDPRLGDEGYRMRIAGAVRIAANRPAGAFYGTRTVLQLLRQDRALPRGRTRDRPRYPERGMMVDVGRKYFTPGWLRRHVRELGWLKLNYLHLHLSDNQGFRIESERHPEIVSDRHLTKNEVASLIALARRHHITVVPEIDMPGHMEAALARHPELQLRNAAGTTSPANLDYSLPEARLFARELVEEYLPLFPGPYWHMGADEYLITVPGFQTPLDYAAYPHLEAYARERYGPDATVKDGILGFVNEIGAVVRGANKELRIWHDGLEGGRVVSVEPATVVDWWIDTAGPTPQELLDQGHRIMNAGWFPTYYVHGPLGTIRPDMRTAYESWEVHEFYGPFVADETAQNPPDVISPNEPRNLGSKLHIWNDDPEEATEDEIADGIFPRLRVIAQKTWSSPPLTPSYEEFVTTYLSWRLVFAGEVLVVIAILFLARRVADSPVPEEKAQLDLVGTVLSALGLALVVYGILRSGTWGLIRPVAGGPTWLGLSPVVWLVLGGGAVLWAFLAWESRVLRAGREPLIDPARLRNPVLRGGLTSFFFQYLLQAGVFFAVPLFLSVALGLSAVATGVRILPLSLTLLAAAVGIPVLAARVTATRVVQFGFLALFAGLVVMIAALDAGAGPEIVTWPLLLAGLGVGSLASQLGAVTVSSVPDEQSSEVGGLQNTLTNLGASIGTALAGAVLISALTSSFITGIQGNTDVPASVSNQATVELSSGVPFVSDAQLRDALDEAGVPAATTDAIVDENEEARLVALRASLGVLALIAIAAVFFTRRIPDRPMAQPQPQPA